MIQTIKYGVSVLWGLWSGTRSFLWDQTIFNKRGKPLFVQSWARLEALSNTNNVSLKLQWWSSLFLLSINFSDCQKLSNNVVHGTHFQRQILRRPHGILAQRSSQYSKSMLCFILYLEFFQLSLCGPAGFPHFLRNFIRETQCRQQPVYHQLPLFQLEGLDNQEPQSMKVCLPGILNELL